MIDKLRENIKNANEWYRKGLPIISDSTYDDMIEELSLLSPDDSLLSEIGFKFDDSRKTKLPITMASMNKIKNVEGIKNWIRLKNIPECVQFILLPKFDGISLCVNEENKKDAYTRGDGVEGQLTNEHYKWIQNKLEYDMNHESIFKYTYGEVMMSKKTFLEKYSEESSNPRNLVGGALNSKDLNEDLLSDLVYIKYGGIQENNTLNWKSDIIDELNAGQKVKVDYKLVTLEDMTEEYLLELFKEWSSKDYEIDGIIIEVNHIGIQNDLGREKSTNNPVYARAYKSPDFEMVGETQCIDLVYQISKKGLLKPVAIVEPIELDGVIISRVTCNNAKFVKEMGIGIGCKLKIKRSGFVIPLIVEVTEKVDFKMPIIDGTEVTWNENGIELITLSETEEQKIKRIVAFFEILGTDNVSDGTIRQIWNNGYKSIKEIINLSIDDLEKLDRFGRVKAEKIYNSIQKSINNSSLSKLQHASGLFDGIGSKKLAILEQFTTKPILEEVMSLDGFAETSSLIYLNGYDKFYEFITDLNIKPIEKVETEKISDELNGKVFVYTGIRDKETEILIESKGGFIGSGVSKNTTHLICKDPESSSSKMQKARDLGIKILSLNDLKDFLK